MKKIIIALVLFNLCLMNAQEPIPFDDYYPWLTEIREYMLSSSVVSSARANAMGGYLPVIAITAEEAIENPASLALIKRTGLSFNFNMPYRASEINYLGYQRTSTKSLTYLSSFTFNHNVIGYIKNFSFAVGYQTVKDFNRSSLFSANTSGLTIDTMIYEKNSEELSGKIGNIFIAGSYQVSKKLFFGAGLNFYSGKYESDFKITRQNSEEYALIEYERGFYINDDISGFSINLGLLYLMEHNLRFSLAIQTPQYYKISDHYQYSFYAEDDEYYYGYEDDLLGEYDYSITLPLKIDIGVGQKTRFLRWGVNFSMQDFSALSYSKEPIEGVKSNISQMYKNSFKINGGIEYALFNSKVLLRTGANYQTLPYKVGREAYYDNYNELVLKSENGNQNVIGYSGGIGFLIDRSIMINLSYSKTRFLLQEQLLEENYSFTIFQLGLIVRF